MDGGCGVCYEIPWEIAVKNCEYRELISRECFNRLDKCPFCRKAFTPSTSMWLSHAEIDLAKRHWRYWFDRMNGFEIT